MLQRCRLVRTYRWWRAGGLGWLKPASSETRGAEVCPDAFARARQAPLLVRWACCVFLALQNVLVGAREGLGNFRPAVLDPYVLWNADELFWLPSAGRR